MGLELLTSLKSFLLDYNSPPGSEGNPLTLEATPGLVTLLDVALYRAVEGELTATVCSGHALLGTFLDLKGQATHILQELRRSETNHSTASQRSHQLESFAQACLEAACDSIEKLSVDRQAQSANLTDPFDHSNYTTGSTTSTSSPQALFSGFVSFQESSLDTARRIPIAQRPCDCWETPRLHCPDYVWADDHVVNNCHRWLRNLLKHPFAASADSSESSLYLSTASGDSPRRHFLGVDLEQQATVLLQLVQYDVPSRLMQFRAAMEAESVVLKRMYLVKCEYRAPFRAFLEGHQSVLRAPSVDLVLEYIGLSRSKIMKRRASAKEKLTAELANPVLVEALVLEQRCEEYEIEIAKQLFGFCELARFLDQKRARLKLLPNLVKEDQVQDLQELLRRLKGLLCRKSGVETTTGIRPLLLDLQGVPRDGDILLVRGETEVFQQRLDVLIDQLKTLARLCGTKHAVRSEQRRSEIDLPSSISSSCQQLDDELLKCRLEDWYSMVLLQHDIVSNNDFYQLAEQLRRAEMHLSLAMAPSDSLEVVRQRVELIAADRQKRFEVLKDVIEDVCLREMFLYVNVLAPERSQPLVLRSTSEPGLFGRALQLAGETLPIG